LRPPEADAGDALAASLTGFPQIAGALSDMLLPLHFSSSCKTDSGRYRE